jgi:NTP pyrophosphatase (non-canonical NTP hydrolase)
VSKPYRLDGLNTLAAIIHERNVRLGFYEPDKVRDFDGMVANIHGEASEALEEWRAGRGFNEHHWTVKDELTDDLIRIGTNGKVLVRDPDPELGFERDMVELTPEILRRLPELIPHLKPEGIPSELADILIRVLDVCGFHQIDIAGAVADKMAYNETRAYRHGGKRS